MQAGDVLAAESAGHGGFELLGELGRGGSAVVWLAQRVDDATPVALKILHDAVGRDPLVARRLRRELAIAERLDHPAALLPRALHTHQGRLVLEMPFHDGITLDEHVRTEGPWTATALDRLARRLAAVLQSAHTAGVVHRDVTPRNVMVDGSGVASLMDFGLARLDGASRTATVASVAGTPGFVAPELLEGDRPSPAADWYGLGGVLYVAATGRAPFAGPTAAAILRAQLDGDHPPLASLRPDLPAALTDTIDALLSADPTERPSGSRALIASLTGRSVVRAAPSAAHDPLAVPTQLPPGPWTVEVRERDHDERRRRQRRRRRHTRSRFAQSAEKVFDDLFETAHRLLARPIPPEPEARLAAAVAVEAGMPAQALAPSPALWERRFRLVTGVDRAVAERLAVTARAEGFKARLTNPALPVPWSTTLRRILLPLVPPLIVAATPAPDFVAWIVFLSATLPMWLSHGIHTDPPLAYGPDLAPHLADGWRAQTAEAVPTPDPRPTRATAPDEDGTARLIRSLRTRLQAVRDRIQGHDALPSLAQRDLSASLDGVSDELDGLAALPPDTATDPTAEAEAVSRLEARLLRLQTLQRAGQREVPGEIAALETTLARHRTALDAADDAEARSIRRVARLLEIGAVLAEVSASLADPEPAQDHVRGLRGDLDQARRALAATRATRSTTS